MKKVPCVLVSVAILFLVTAIIVRLGGVSLPIVGAVKGVSLLGFADTCLLLAIALILKHGSCDKQ